MQLCRIFAKAINSNWHQWMFDTHDVRREPLNHFLVWRNYHCLVSWLIGTWILIRVKRCSARSPCLMPLERSWTFENATRGVLRVKNSEFHGMELKCSPRRLELLHFSHAKCFDVNSCHAFLIRFVGGVRLWYFCDVSSGDLHITANTFVCFFCECLLATRSDFICLY